MAKHTVQMSNSHPGMVAVRLRTIFRAVITLSRPRTWHCSIPPNTALLIEADAVGFASVNQPGDRLPRDQSP
jgi:hypothetical protein